VVVERVGFDGSALASTTNGVSADAGAVAAVQLPDALASPDDPARELLVASIGEQRSFWYFAVDRDLVYPEAQLTAEDVRASDTGAVLTVRAGGFVRDLTLFVDRVAPDAAVDDGLVTLLPGERTTFTIEGIDAERAATLLEPPNVGTANALG
jgi:beta-mannosidase